MGQLTNEGFNRTNRLKIEMERKKILCNSNYTGIFCGVKKKNLTAAGNSCMIVKAVRTMEKIVEQTLLYDFYGELLTDHQKKVYEDVVFNDLSLSEAAEVHGISRQGVHDLIRRCGQALQNYEAKLGLVEKFLKTQEKVRKIHCLTREFLQTGDRSLILKIEEISGEISRL